MDTIGIIIPQIFVLWVMVAGLAYMTGGQRWASSVVMWPIRTAVRLIRRAVGGIIVALGQWIRG